MSWFLTKRSWQKLTGLSQASDHLQHTPWAEVAGSHFLSGMTIPLEIQAAAHVKPWLRLSAWDNRRLPPTSTWFCIEATPTSRAYRTHFHAAIITHARQQAHNYSSSWFDLHPPSSSTHLDDGLKDT